LSLWTGKEDLAVEKLGGVNPRGCYAKTHAEQSRSEICSLCLVAGQTSWDRKLAVAGHGHFPWIMQYHSIIVFHDI
jgi:hypothetical protein